MKKNKVETAVIATLELPAVETIPAVEIPAVIASAVIASARFDGFEVSAEAIGKIERDWQSARGRIEKAVDAAGDEIDLGGSMARHKSGIKSGKDATRRKVAIVDASPAAVDRASKYLVENKHLGERDAELWRAYVRLALAFEAMRAIGRL